MEEDNTGVTHSRREVAAQLRAMAAGAAPYARFTYTSPWIKNIWRAAADMLDPPHDP